MPYVKAYLETWHSHGRDTEWISAMDGVLCFLENAIVLVFQSQSGDWGYPILFVILCGWHKEAVIYEVMKGKEPHTVRAYVKQ